MSKEIIDRYKNNKAIIVSRDVDSTPLLQVSDIMVSDTSSIVYEFIFLDKPVVTLNSQSENIVWSDVNNADDLLLEVRKILNGVDNHLEDRKTLIDKYHPYIDGESSKRMIDAVEGYLLNNKVPEKRKVPWHRKIKMIRKYGYN
jgi:CDP-glycerol glycerophosphotransferase (TagB/SpsB family)